MTHKYKIAAIVIVLIFGQARFSQKSRFENKTHVGGTALLANPEDKPKDKPVEPPDIPIIQCPMPQDTIIYGSNGKLIVILQ